MTVQLVDHPDVLFNSLGGMITALATLVAAVSTLIIAVKNKGTIDNMSPKVDDVHTSTATTGPHVEQLYKELSTNPNLEALPKSLFEPPDE